MKTIKTFFGDMLICLPLLAIVVCSGLAQGLDSNGALMNAAVLYMTCLCGFHCITWGLHINGHEVFPRDRKLDQILEEITRIKAAKLREEFRSWGS